MAPSTIATLMPNASPLPSQHHESRGCLPVARAQPRVVDTGLSAPRDHARLRPGLEVGHLAPEQVEHLDPPRVRRSEDAVGVGDGERPLLDRRPHPEVVLLGSSPTFTMEPSYVEARTADEIEPAINAARNSCGLTLNSQRSRSRANA